MPFIYDEGVARSLKQAFINDMKVSYRLTKENYEQRSTWVKFKEGISITFTNFITFNSEVRECPEPLILLRSHFMENELKLNTHVII